MHPPDPDQYIDYSRFSPETLDTATGSDWSQIVSVLDASRREEYERVLEQLNAVEIELEEMKQVHDSMVGSLEFQIDQYESQLERLASIPKDEDERLRLRRAIRDLQQGLRREHQEFRTDRQRLLNERRELVREISELQDDTWSELM